MHGVLLGKVNEKLDWIGVDPLQQVVSREDALVAIPWLSIVWQLESPDHGHFLWWDQQGLHLKSADIDIRSSVHVDFVKGSQARRIKSVAGEALTRAVGCYKGMRPAIIDATAGLGGDMSVLANLGCQVLAFERHPLVAALLQDALRRAEAAGFDWIDRVRLIYQDAAEVVASVSHGVIYLDPMFPKERKASPALSMQVLQTLEQTVIDSNLIFEAAMDSNAARIVVKRPLKAEYLGRCAPNSQVKAKTVRFDLYPKRKLTNYDEVSHAEIRGL